MQPRPSGTPTAYDPSQSIQSLPSLTPTSYQPPPPSQSIQDYAATPEPPAKKSGKGRQPGSQTFREEDKRRAFRDISEIGPDGNNLWEKTACLYNKWAKLEDRKERDHVYLKSFYTGLIKQIKGTGATEMPWDVREAKRIKDEIESKIHTGSIGMEVDEDSESGTETDTEDNDSEASHDSESNAWERAGRARREQEKAKSGTIFSANKLSERHISLPPPTQQSTIDLHACQTPAPSRKRKTQSPSKISLEIAQESSRQKPCINAQATDFMGRLVTTLVNNQGMNPVDLALIHALNGGGVAPNQQQAFAMASATQVLMEVFKSVDATCKELQAENRELRKENTELTIQLALVQARVSSHGHSFSDSMGQGHVPGNQGVSQSFTESFNAF
jgi:hypothetical protein